MTPRQTRIIAPSLLSADFLHLEEEIRMLNESEAAWIHLDIMDGVFVPNISFGFPIISAVSRISKKICDVHLMIENPDPYIKDFAKAGANILSVHYETCRHLNRTIAAIHDEGMKAGVVLNPHTPVGQLENILPYVDMILLMSVNPGFGGQKFIPETFLKIKQLEQMRRERELDFLIQVDGGVNGDNAEQLFDHGANILVAGSYVFGSENPRETIKSLLYKK